MDGDTLTIFSRPLQATDFVASEGDAVSETYQVINHYNDDNFVAESYDSSAGRSYGRSYAIYDETSTTMGGPSVRMYTFESYDAYTTAATTASSASNSSSYASSLATSTPASTSEDLNVAFPLSGSLLSDGKTTSSGSTYSSSSTS